MIKFNGPNYKKGDGDYCLFGNFLNGDGNGNGKSSYLFYYNSYPGNGSGNGNFFGNRLGDGGSWNSNNLKKEYLK